MSALTDFQAYLAAAQTAFAGGDFTEARRQVTQARMSLAQIPNSASDGTSAQWREDLKEISDAITAESGLSVRSVTTLSEFIRG